MMPTSVDFPNKTLYQIRRYHHCVPPIRTSRKMWLTEDLLIVQQSLDLESPMAIRPAPKSHDNSTARFPTDIFPISSPGLCRPARMSRNSHQDVSLLLYASTSQPTSWTDGSQCSNVAGRLLPHHEEGHTSQWLCTL